MFQRVARGSPIPTGDETSMSQAELRRLGKKQRRRIVAMVLEGKVYGLPGSNGTMFSNFCQWAKNQHPALSVFFAHEAHPFGRCERMSVLFCYLCWAFFITALFTQSNSDMEVVCNSGCKKPYRRSHGEWFCGGGSGSYSKKMPVEAYDEACASVIDWYIVSLMLAAWTVPFSTVLKVLATCWCVRAWPRSVRRPAEWIGAQALKAVGVLSLFCLVLAFYFASRMEDGTFAIMYISGVVESGMYWPLLGGASFLWRFRRDKAEFEMENPGQVALAWPVISEDLEPRGSPDGQQQHDGLFPKSTGPSILPYYYEAVGCTSKSPKNAFSRSLSAAVIRPLLRAGAPEHPGLAQRGKSYVRGALQSATFPAIPGSRAIPTILERCNGTNGVRGSPDRTEAVENVEDPLATDQETKKTQWYPPVVQQLGPPILGFTRRARWPGTSPSSSLPTYLRQPRRTPYGI